MNPQQNISMVRALFDEVYTKGNISICDQILANEVRVNDPAAPNFRGGIDAFKEREAVYRLAFPNKVTRIDDIFATEDRVVVRWTAQATHTGPLQDILPTEKNVKVSGISVFNLVNGKIQEIFQSWDRLGLLEQLGAILPLVALHS